MKRSFFLALAFLVFNAILAQPTQLLLKNSRVTGVCYAGKKVKRVYIPPPRSFFTKNLAKSGGLIIVNYSGFSSQAKTPIEFAVSILEAMLPADTRLTINASWEKIPTSGILAQSSITGYAGGWGINALNPLCLYPVALAEKIAGKSLNSDSDGDIILTVNSSVNWYLGTDGQTPGRMYDLVTVALHEICHGLGFYESFSSDGSTGSYGIGSFPIIYDTFVENLDGNRLTDTLKIKNNSNDLGNQLVSNQLYFNGPLLKEYSSSVNYTITRAKLFAPVIWDKGSSISHLDESATLQENSLMTPYIDLGEAIHDPGKYTFSILGDIGWINTSLIHKVNGDTESHLTQLLLSVEIKSDTAYNHNKVGAVFSFDNFLTSDTVYLQSPNSNNFFNTSITIPSYNTDLQYYFFTEDCFNRLYRSPSMIKDSPVIKNKRYHVYIGTDTVKPVISHSPVSYYLQTVDSIKFRANATDNLGIDSVYIEFRINKGASRFIRLSRGDADNYGTGFKAKSLSLKGHDSIEYRIFAVDTAMIPNLKVVPHSGYFKIPVEGISSTINGYSTDFSSAAPDFFNIGFEVTKPAGFSNFGLNTKHPYESPEDNNKSINYTAILRHPLKFNESGMFFSFNELVLVEPGEPGSVFGSTDFYDYVILEGSKNFGKTWFNLLDGYDSRYFPAWDTAYNSSIVGDNSTFSGTEVMLRKHTFLYRPSDNISGGDTMLLRFRLFSDPFANGWGWVIEDLKINAFIDAIHETADHHFIVYPNPGRGVIKLTSDLTGIPDYKPVHYKIFNGSGICIVNTTMTGAPETLIDISRYPSGIYIILIYLDDGIQKIKYSLIRKN
jgi:hypothetical protein